MNHLPQILITVFSLTAAVLSQSSLAERRRYACIAGLLAQPWWIYETWRAGQWGMLGLTMVYLGIWFVSFVRQWIK